MKVGGSNEKRRLADIMPVDPYPLCAALTIITPRMARSSQTDRRSPVMTAIVEELQYGIVNHFEESDVVPALEMLKRLYGLTMSIEAQQKFAESIRYLGNQLPKAEVAKFLQPFYDQRKRSGMRMTGDCFENVLLAGMVTAFDPMDLLEREGVFGETEALPVEIEKFVDREDNLGNFTREYLQLKREVPSTIRHLKVSLQDEILSYNPITDTGFEEWRGLRGLLAVMMGKDDYLKWAEEHKDRLDYLAGEKEALPTDILDIPDDIRRLAENDCGTFGELAKRVITHLQCHAMDLAAEARFLPTHSDHVGAEEITEKLKELMIQCCSPDSAKNKENRRLLQVMLEAMIGKEATIEWLGSPDCPTILSPDPTDNTPSG